MRSGMGPRPTHGRRQRGWSALLVLGLAACGDTGRPPAPVSPVGSDEDPSVIDDAGDGGDDAGRPGDGGSDGATTTPSDAGPKPDAKPSSDTTARRLVVSDLAGKLRVFETNGSPLALGEAHELEAPERARVVAGPGGRYAYVFAPGGESVQVLDVGLHLDANDVGTLEKPAYVDGVTLKGAGVRAVVAGPADAAPNLAVAFDGESAQLFAAEPALVQAGQAAGPWGAGQLAHEALAFFVGPLALRSVASDTSTTLELVSGGGDPQCTSPTTAVGRGPGAVVACADGLRVLTASGAALQSRLVDTATRFELGAANEQGFAVATDAVLILGPYADGTPAPIVKAALGTRAVALALAQAGKSKGAVVLDEAGALTRYDAAGRAGESIATGCATASGAARPGLLVDAGFAYLTCPSSGKLVIADLNDPGATPTATDLGGTPGDLVLFGYAH